MELDAVQKAACESVWRNVQHSGELPKQLRDVKGLPLPVALRRIATYVSSLPHESMSALVLPEMQRRGKLVSGYTARWENITQASARYDAHIAENKARGEMRMSEVPTWARTPSTSSDAGSAPRPSMQQNNSQNTLKG